jgi:hypothetical protein
MNDRVSDRDHLRITGQAERHARAASVQRTGAAEAAKKTGGELAQERYRESERQATAWARERLAPLSVPPPPPPGPSKAGTYRAKHRLFLGGHQYVQAGTIVQLSDADARAALGVGAVEPVPPPEPELDVELVEDPS